LAGAGARKKIIIFLYSYKNYVIFKVKIIIIKDYGGHRAYKFKDYGGHPAPSGRALSGL
jgi:hypothetical protein